MKLIVTQLVKKFPAFDGAGSLDFHGLMNPLQNLASLYFNTHFHNIVTYRPISKLQVCKQVAIQESLLGNSSVDTLFPWQRENTQ
jgi:hypothetical protein